MMNSSRISEDVGQSALGGEGEKAWPNNVLYTEAKGDSER